MNYVYPTRIPELGGELRVELSRETVSTGEVVDLVMSMVDDAMARCTS